MRFIAVALLSVVFIAPFSASAQMTSAQLQAQIASLLQQLLALQAQIGTTPVTEDESDWDESSDIIFTINGSSGPVSVKDGQKVTFKWDARDAGVENCFVYYPGKNNGVSKKVKLSGSKKATIYPSTFVAPYAALSCNDEDTGEEMHTYVNITQSVVTPSTEGSTSNASISVSGSGEERGVRVTYTNLPKNSYIELLWLNPNNQYESVEQTSVSKGGNGKVTMTVSEDAPNGTYIARVKSTQNMYWQVDSFQFVIGGGTSSLNCTLKSSVASAKKGETVTLTWLSRGASYGLWVRDSNSSSPLPGDKLNPSDVFSFKMPATEKDAFQAVLNVYGPNGLKGTCKTNILYIPEKVTTSNMRGAAIVGIYEGGYPSGVSHSYNNHPEGTVYLHVTGDTGQNRDLVLTAYEPTNWVLSVDPGVKITKIIATGYYDQRVTNIPFGTQYEYRSYVSNNKGYYAYQSSGDAYEDLVEWLLPSYKSPYGSDGNWNMYFPGYSTSSSEVYIGYKG